ncbi:PEP-CTERM sorting domain-containing protein [Oscillatoria sp. FACHB-1407]|uniref:PEP-CTERM sorting domain-containing protein n=1 Tax=Oscillatoria sp. FACHB-1407 TaxID=2692847 RepID=UPI0016867081|nr:PEP-CTERM sorting domain-containing protein [Oscillatoria sp. FACHB-1407]MBD2461191.1 PEP-CTERM sorting domain-containing protein [Oscillatoria sp. FACHB-1407]
MPATASESPESATTLFSIPTGFSEPQPVSLSILNPSFEDDVLGGDGSVDYVTGWQILSSSLWSVGTYRPGSGLYVAHVPDGVNVAYANSGSLFQRLTDSLAANTQYTLGVDVGSRPPYGFPGYQIDLLAGETVIASVSSPVPEFGKFISTELVYTASESDPLLGQPLAIRLSSGGIQVNFDNVRLTALSLAPAIETAATEIMTEQAIAPEDAPSVESVDSLPAEFTVEAEPVELEWVFATRMLPATAGDDEEDSPQSVPEPTSVIGLLLGAAALIRLKRQPSKS